MSRSTKKGPFVQPVLLKRVQEMNDKGEASDEEVLKEIDDIVNNRNKDFYLEKCKPLDEFEKEIIKLKNKEIKQTYENCNGNKT